MERVRQDCLAKFEEIKPLLPYDHYILDLAWLGSGDVVVIEVNPFDDVLGTFPASTGLFLWEEDGPTMRGETGEGCQIRVRREREAFQKLKHTMSPAWKKVVRL